MPQNYDLYLKALRGEFVKLCRLRFLQPDGSTAFALDNNPFNPRAFALIADGRINMNFQNGRRRSATVTLKNISGDYDYNVNHLWFGTEIALDEGLLLPNLEDFYIQQGVFLLNEPEELLQPGRRTARYELVDKFANLDGTILGSLEGTHKVDAGNFIFGAIASILSDNRWNGKQLDSTPPVFTNYYNGITQKLPNGEIVSVLESPSDLIVDGISGTVADIVEGLCAFLGACFGYDTSGALRIDPSQNDISDADKPIAWDFMIDDATILQASYKTIPTDVYNDYIVEGGQLADTYQPWGRASNYDEASDTNIQTIGRRTKRYSNAGYVTVKQCMDRAAYELKRASILRKSVSITCRQIFHIDGNEIVTLVRTDKPGQPIERYLVQGFSRPLVGTQPMTLEAVAVSDLPFMTATGAGLGGAVPIPAQRGTLRYNGEVQSPKWDGYLPAAMNISGTIEAVEAGTYYAVFSLKEPEYVFWSDGTSTSKQVPWNIEGEPVALPVQSGALTYNGSAQTPTWSAYSESQLDWGGAYSAADAGNYTALFTPKSGYTWAVGGGAEARAATWTIQKASQQISLSPRALAVGPGESATISVNRKGTGAVSAKSSARDIMTSLASGTVVTVQGVAEGNATLTVSVEESQNYLSGSASASITVTKSAKILTLPSQSGTLTYTGSSQSPSWSGFDAEGMTVGGTTQATNAGTYAATFTPNSGYQWADGTTTAKNVAWSIQRATGRITLSATSVSFNVGDSQALTVTAEADGARHIVSSDNDIAAGAWQANTLTVRGQGAGTAEIELSCEQGTNYTAASASVTVIVADLSNITATIAAETSGVEIIWSDAMPTSYGTNSVSVATGETRAISLPKGRVVCLRYDAWPGNVTITPVSAYRTLTSITDVGQNASSTSDDIKYDFGTFSGDVRITT